MAVKIGVEALRREVNPAARLVAEFLHHKNCILLCIPHMLHPVSSEVVHFLVLQTLADHDSLVSLSFRTWAGTQLIATRTFFAEIFSSNK